MNKSFQPIPAIDILNGQAVRLTKGDYKQVTVYGDPIAFAKRWEKAGAQTIHLVDLDGAKAGRPINLETIKRIRQSVDCQLELGGGIRTAKTVQEILELGVNEIILGSVALKNRQLTEELVKKYQENIIVGIDAKDGYVAAEGWLEKSQVKVEVLSAEMEKLGVGTIIYTDIGKDGMLSGPNLKAYEELVSTTSMKVIASGGISCLQDVKNLEKIEGLSGVIVGKALYENRIKVEELFS